jgi:hypothetical protein
MPMQRLVMFLSFCAAAACSASPRSKAVEHPAPATPIIDPVRTGHANVDLTGGWATGSGDEPTAKQIVLRPECNYSPAVWIIQQNGDTVRAWAIPASHAQGVATRQSVSAVPLEGWISGVDLTLGTSGTRYRLHYDSTSTHLRGTLNGASFWAVRQQIVRPTGCIAVP